jgi:transcription elongation factor Elf1
MLYMTGSEHALECPHCGAEILPEEELVHELDLGEVVNCPLCEEETECEDFEIF